MDVRMMLMSVLVLPIAAAAADSPPKPPVGQPPPREIIVVDDVGVGDHFPSHVPGAGKYRLPELDVAPRREAPPEPGASDPADWAAPPSRPVATVAAAPQPAVDAQVEAGASVAAPTAPVGADLEQQTLLRASDSLLSGACEPELPRLAELLERTQSAGVKARVRILRARCFAQRSRPTEAKREYVAYLKDFPEGLWADEARAAAVAQ